MRDQLGNGAKRGRVIPPSEPSAAEPAAAPELIVAGARLVPRLSGALFWPARQLLTVGDLHLGRSERLARQGGTMLPPYETLDTLNRFEAEVLALAPRLVLCLGDSFDDLDASAGLGQELRARIERLSAGRRWVWVAGNHDPGPVELPGSHLAEVGLGPLAFRHIAAPDLALGQGEISGHYHPKARLTRRGQRISRPCFLASDTRVILPAFGTYTGGLDIAHPAFDPLFPAGAEAVLLGPGKLTALDRAACA